MIAVRTMNNVSSSESKPDEATVERRLNDLIKERTTIQEKIKQFQNELDKLIQRGPKKVRETKAELDQQIVKLEKQRTHNSMPLAQERDILKQIGKLEKQKRLVDEYDIYDKELKQVKSTVFQLRETLRNLNASISLTRVELSNIRTAKQLGCSVEELLGMRVDCPKDKLGNLIGKGGKNVKSLMEKANVSVEVGRTDGDVRIIGSIHSLDAAAQDLGRILATTDEIVEVGPALVNFFTSKNIRALGELKVRHPDVIFDVNRKSTQVKLRGIPADIESAKEDVLSITVSTKEIPVTSQEAALVIGKQGANVERLVALHQAAIEVSRLNDEKANIILTGPAENVETALDEIEETLAANREIEETVPISAHVKTVLLQNGGAGIQVIHKKINETTKDLGGSVGVNFADDGVVVRGKSKVLPLAVKLLEAELIRLQALVVEIHVPPEVIPVIIGKGGQGIKKLTEGITVNVEVDKSGQVFVSALQKEDVVRVVNAIKEIVKENQIMRIDFETIDFGPKFRDFLRLHTKQVNELVHFSGDDDNRQVVLRGNAENLEKAAAIVKSFLEKNFIDKMDITMEDLNVLLSGGKKSKIVQFATEHGVRLSTERENLAIEGKGEKEKVAAAFNAIRCFLNGGEGVAVTKLAIEDQLLGVVIGKGGKNKADLEKKYLSLTITVSRTESCLFIRGPEADVESCCGEIAYLVATARISRSVPITEQQSEALNKSNASKRIYRIVPAQISVASTSIVVKGMPADVEEAIVMLKEEISGIYETKLQIDPKLYRRIHDTCRDRSHLDRVCKASGATVSLDVDKDAIFFSGKRDRVRVAKIEINKFFEFVFGDCFSRLEVPVALLGSVGKAAFLADISAKSGARVVLDRDLNVFYIFSADKSKVQKAIGTLKSRLQDGGSLVVVLRLDESEDWIASQIIGKGGARIKPLRKQVGCNIEVDTKELTVTISGDDVDKVAKAKETIEGIITEARKQCAQVAIPENDLAAFVGRSGAHIKEFSSKYDVNIQVGKDRQSGLRITGSVENVAAANAAVMDWLVARNGARVEAQGTESVQIREDQIPVVIGSKGSVIRALEQEFGCRINVEKQECLVTIRGSSAEKRSLTLEKIKALLTESVSTDGEGSADTEEPKAEEKAETVQETTQAPREADEKPNGAAKKKEESPRSVDKPPVTPAAFPSLPTVKSGEQSETVVTNGSNNRPAVARTPSGPSWASVVSVQPSQKAAQTVEQEIQQLADTTSTTAAVLASENWDGSDDGMSEELRALEGSVAEVRNALNGVEQIP